MTKKNAPAKKAETKTEAPKKDEAIDGDKARLETMTKAAKDL